ncbi:hypothetical protein ACFLXE_04345 [Chloroflexota bacterium]
MDVGVGLGDAVGVGDGVGEGDGVAVGLGFSSLPHPLTVVASITTSTATVKAFNHLPI